MDRSDASALADLKMHWDEAYVIGMDGNVWSARYRSSADELRAHTCTELRELIRSDYAYRQKVDRPIDNPDDEDETYDYEDYGFYEADDAAERDATLVTDGDPTLDDPTLDDPALDPADAEPAGADLGAGDARRRRPRRRRPRRRRPRRRRPR